MTCQRPRDRRAGGAISEANLAFCGQPVPPGGRRTVEAAVSGLYNGDPLMFRMVVIRGREPGPTLFIMAALHGDEVVGVEIIRRLIHEPDYGALRGTLLLVPVGNPFGFLNRSRYLPDRGDLNRSFPGLRRGSPTARMADFLFREVIAPCDYGIELHTAAARRRNVPQLRADLQHPRVRRLAEAFGGPYRLHSPPPAGSIRASVDADRTAVVLYETGEILRVNEECVRTGLSGCLNVLRELEMLPGPAPRPPEETHVFRRTRWLRAEHGGLLLVRAELGQHLGRGDLVAITTDPLGERQHEVRAPRDGTVIGLTTLPLANPGDAVCHLAW